MLVEALETALYLQRADYKLIFVAVILILLRLWDLPVEFMLYSDSIAGKFNHTYAAAALLLLGVSPMIMSPTVPLP